MINIVVTSSDDSLGGVAKCVVYIYKSMNDVETWYNTYLLSLGYYRYPIIGFGSVDSRYNINHSMK